jgi:uncharacterized protein YjbJ (UPF0337 family)
MNKEQFSTQWQQLRLNILDRWNRLTDEDLRQINGRYDLLVSKIQEKYGISRDEIDEQFRSWKPSARFDNERRDDRRDVVTSRTDKEEEGSSLGKWLVAAGIPFLFLLGYLGTHYNTPAVRDDAYTPNSSTESTQTMYTRTPASSDIDNTISQNVRKSLFANSGLLTDLKDVRIESSNGVVTVYGSVKTEDQKALINSLVERVSGVTQVNNKVDVRL